MLFIIQIIVIKLSNYSFPDTSCMAAELSFEELFDHLGEYVQDRDYRWKLCMRVKRALSNTDCCGGIGHDQVYFEGWSLVRQRISL